MLIQLEAFLHNSDVYEKIQFGFRGKHSTGTALTKIINDLRMSADEKKVSVLVLLDLTTAFDTIDHEILLNRLESWIGLSRATLSWFNTYLTDRNYFVNLGDCVSDKQSIHYGVPQGAILGLVLFNLYMDS